MANGPGADALLGGRGADVITGGTGADRFIYRNAAESTSRNPDLIRDFKVVQGDKIDLRAFDANPRTSARDRFIWRGSKPFTRQPGELRFADGKLLGDTTGNGKANFKIVLRKVTRLPKRAIRF